MTCMSEHRLDGRRAIITGGASGIGKATAVAFAELGADVVVADIDDVNGTAVAAEVGGTFVRLDVGDSAAWADVVAAHGPFDIAFLNAGIAVVNEHVDDGTLPITWLTEEAYRRIVRINVDGVVFGAQAVLPGMVERGSGDIVATASVAGIKPIALDPAYGLTKHAVVGFVRSVAEGMNRPGAPDICVSAICPGYTETGIIGDRIRDRIAERGVELMTPEHVATVVVRAVTERAQGAQWVIWPGVEPSIYDWNPGIPS
jgi:NAD(P)-dependent dehydrogenase (short-subunit alcohol dehydrogenase family)